MIDKSNLFSGKIVQDAEGSLYSIFNLCKMGIAANDSCMSIDVKSGGNDALFEIIAVLAEDAIARLEIERSERKTPSTSVSVQEGARTA